MVACPRDHLELSTGRSRIRKGPAFCMSTTQRQNAGKLTAQFHLQRPVLRHQADHLDQAADEIEGFRLVVRPLEQLAQRGEPLVVDLGKIGMEERLGSGGSFSSACSSTLRAPRTFRSSMRERGASSLPAAGRECGGCVCRPAQAPARPQPGPRAQAIAPREERKSCDRTGDRARAASDEPRRCSFFAAPLQMDPSTMNGSRRPPVISNPSLLIDFRHN